LKLSESYVKQYIWRFVLNGLKKKQFLSAQISKELYLKEHLHALGNKELSQGTMTSKGFHGRLKSKNSYIIVPM
jgi:hypothetical protein